MKINLDKWQSFSLKEIFTKIESGKVSQAGELEEGPDIPYLGAKKADNGIMSWCKYVPDKVSKGNCVVMICDGAGSVGLANYMNTDFMGTVNLALGYNDKFLNEYTGLFLATILSKERIKYSFGRKWKTHLNDTNIRLPATRNGHPDWKWMEKFVKSLKSKHISTDNNKICSLDDISKWKLFSLKNLFRIVYGVNLDFNKCEETTADDPEGIAFVSRTESDNGVSGWVKPIPGVDAQPANTITVAGGGSVLSTFLQTRKFYSGRDLYLLYPYIDISKKAKLFIITILKANKYRYNYGRQANVTLPELELMLPVTDEGKPDWEWMEEYISKLPYGDRI